MKFDIMSCEFERLNTLHVRYMIIDQILYCVELDFKDNAIIFL